MECFDSGAILSSSSHAALTKSEVLSYLQILQIRAQEENIDFGLYPWYHVQNLRCLMASWLWLNPSVSSLKHAILGVYPNLRNTLMMLQTTCSQKSVMQYLKISPQRRLQDWGKTPTDYHRFIVFPVETIKFGGCSSSGCVKPIFLMLMFGFQSLLLRGIFWVSGNYLHFQSLSYTQLISGDVVLMGFGGDDRIQCRNPNVGLNPIPTAKIGIHTTLLPTKKTLPNRGNTTFL